MPTSPSSPVVGFIGLGLVGRVREALLGGFAASRVFEVHAQRAIERNFKPGGPFKHYHEDMRIILEAGRDHGVPLLFSARVQQFVNRLIAEGHGDDDYAVLISAFDRLAGAEA